MVDDGRYVEGSVWFYAPNQGAPVFFAVAFMASGLVHVWQAMRYKSWRLTGLYVFCSVLFTAGFIAREVGAFRYDDLIVYIVSICLVYAAPPLYELANYYILGRILYFVPYHAPIHPGRVLTTFAVVSIAVEALNGNGAAYTANQALSAAQRETGQTLIKAALLLQLVVVAALVGLAATFHVRCRRAGLGAARVEQPLMTLYLSSGLLATRTVYRAVEYFALARAHDHGAPGFDATTLPPLVRYEWFFYVFEAALMLANGVLLNVRHPRRWLPPSTRVYLARDGVTEVVGPGYRQERRFLATLVDPFDIYGLVKGRDKQTQFWDEEEQAAAEAAAAAVSGQKMPQTPSARAGPRSDGQQGEEARETV